MLLEKEQEQLLIKLVEAHRNVPSGQRQEFFVGHTVGPPGVELFHPAIPKKAPRVFEGDLKILASKGLISVSYGSLGIESFFINPEGFQTYNHIKKKAGQPLERVQHAIKDYINGNHFRSRYPAAYSKWEQAEKLLWEVDSKATLTTIGHLTRPKSSED